MSPIFTGVPERAAVPPAVAVGEAPAGAVVGEPEVLLELDDLEDELHPAVKRSKVIAAPLMTETVAFVWCFPGCGLNLVIM